MKKLFVIILLPFFVYSSCNEDDTINTCTALNLADLLLGIFSSTELNTQNNTVYFDIGHSILNSTQDVLCPDQGVETASASTFNKNIYYNPVNDFSGANKEDNVETSLNPLSAGSSANVNTEIAFLQNGFYFIEHEIDVNNDVSERDENNNSGINSKAILANMIIIHVTGASAKSPKIDENGNPILFEIVSEEVTYFN